LPLPSFAEFHCRPAQAALRDLYSQCDLWLCGSDVEGFHLPPLEAMACRCPVVATRVGGPMDIVEEGVNGHLVDTKDSSALAQRMQTVLQLPAARWRQMSDAALETATRYSWHDATLKFEEALHRAIDRGEALGETATSSAADAESQQP
jgi:glycosyltransferase involved in cell wall biosynthesis